MTASAVLLTAHGTVDHLDDLPEFLTNIRRGHPPPEELVHEVRRRYEAIGGQSPLNAINRELAQKIEARVGVPTRLSNRLFRPYAKDVLAELAAAGAEQIVVVPLAQYSVHVYGEAVRQAAESIQTRSGKPLTIRVVEPWGEHPVLVDAFARELRNVLGTFPAGTRSRVLMTAHSLPTAIIRGGDPYESLVRKSADAVARAANLETHHVVFQSQGMSAGPGGRPMEWLGPDLKSALDEAKTAGDTHVVACPLGFLADHVEILYDLDIEARDWAKERGLTFLRTASLNASDPMVHVIADLVEGQLRG